MERIETAVEALEEQRRRLKRTRAVHMAVYVAAAALFFSPALRPAGLALAGLGLLLHFCVTRRMAEAYKAAASQANLRFGLCAGFSEFAYQPKGGMSCETFRAWALAPLREEGLLCRNAFTGRRGGLALTGQEATFHYALPGGKRVLFLSGTLLTAGEPGGAGWLFLRPGAVDGAALGDFLTRRRYDAAPIEAAGWTAFRQAGAPELPEDLLQRIAALEESVSILRLTDGGGAAFLNGRFCTGSRFPSIQPTAELLRENLLPEGPGIWELFRRWLTLISNKTI